MRIEFEVVTALGRPIKTFDERRAATRYAAEAALTFPGCAVFEVAYSEPQRRRVWTDRTPERQPDNIFKLRSA